MNGTQQKPGQTPSDLITIAEAQVLVKRSRSWILARVDDYIVGRNVMVSKSAVLKAEQEYMTPRPNADDQ